MSDLTLVIFTWDKCNHCVKFKNKLNESGMTSMDELIYNVNKNMPNIVVRKANIDGKGDPNEAGIPKSFYNLEKSWFPSFYLFPTNEFNSGNMTNGKVMGGVISNNVIYVDGSKRSLNPKEILEWIERESESRDKYIQYEEDENEKNRKYARIPRYADYSMRLNKI